MSSLLLNIKTHMENADATYLDVTAFSIILDAFRDSPDNQICLYNEGGDETNGVRLITVRMVVRSRDFLTAKGGADDIYTYFNQKASFKLESIPVIVVDANHIPILFGLDEKQRKRFVIRFNFHTREGNFYHNIGG